MRFSFILKSFLLLLLGFFLITATGYTQQKKHQVKEGETLFSIAKKYKISVENLRAWNDFDENDDELRIGQILIIQNQPSDNAITHIVEAQETLFSISKQYGVSISEIKSWNNLSNSNLNIGQELLIYTEDSGEADADNTTRQSESMVVKSNTQRNTYYTVKRGDTLFDIARAHDMTVPELKKLNDLTSDNIAIGQQLTVRETSAPPSVSSSDTKSSPQGRFIVYNISESQDLQEILSRFKMDESEFRALNPDLSYTKFQPGQKVTVLAPPTKSLKNPYISSSDIKELGKVSTEKYKPSEIGNTTTSGELYNPEQLTAAHSNISIGTILLVRNPTDRKGIYIRINDRISGGGLKLSEAAWNALDLKGPSPTVVIYQNHK